MGTATALPLLQNNSVDAFIADEFEHIDGGAIYLAANARKCTFGIENKRLSAIRFADAGVGEVKGYIRQWGE